MLQHLAGQQSIGLENGAPTDRSVESVAQGGAPVGTRCTALLAESFEKVAGATRRALRSFPTLGHGRMPRQERRLERDQAEREDKRQKARILSDAGLLPGTKSPHLRCCLRWMRSSLKKTRQRPTLPPTRVGSTIGSEKLNFRVRYGIGCGLLDIATGILG